MNRWSNKVSEGRCGAPNSWEREGEAYFGTQVFGFARRRGATAARNIGLIRFAGRQIETHACALRGVLNNKT